MGERAVFDQALEVRSIHAVLDGVGQARTHLGLVAIADGLNQQVAQRTAVELHAAEHVEHLSTQGLPRLFQLFQQPAIDITLARLLGHQVPQVTDLGLSNAMDAADTLLTLGRDPTRLGAALGFTLVLHTWTRDLRFHPHVHGIVPGGGLDLLGDRWRSARQHFLFPVAVLSKLFRGKFLAALASAHGQGHFPAVDEQRFRRLVCQLRGKNWITYAKRPFGGPGQVVSYLGRYTHRVGLSNSRLVAVTEHAVIFATKNGATATLTPEEFLRRFLLHVLPPRFVSIRHYGLCAPANIHTRLRRAQELLGPVPAPSRDPAGANPADSGDAHVPPPPSAPLCPHCRTRTLRIVGDVGRRGYRRRLSHPPPDT